MTKVVTIVGTRPELIRLSCTINLLDQHVDHILVHTGQNYDYELNQVFFEDLNIRKPDYFLHAAGNTYAETIGNTIAKSDELFQKEKPDAFLLLGDTNSCLAAISAKRRKIPIFHMEAGNRCFDFRVPEEINRQIVDHISDVNLTYTEHARHYLIAEGLRPELVIKTGSPMREIFNTYKNKIKNSRILSQLKLSPKDYILVSAHREENIDNEKNFSNLLKSLIAIEKKFQKTIIVSTHPRTRKKIEAQKINLENSNIRFLRPFGYSDYINLQQNAFCTASDSGTVTEESSIIGFPAVTIREVHERPEGTDEGILIMCGLQPENVIEAIGTVTRHSLLHKPLQPVLDYQADNVSIKVLRTILSYIEYVNRVVWHKI